MQFYMNPLKHFMIHLKPHQRGSIVIWHGTQWLKGKEAKRGHILDKSN